MANDPKLRTEAASPIRVLLVDDEPSLLRGLSRTLTAAGYDVVTAADGRHAVNEIQARPADVVVSDIKMPGMDGLALLQAIRGQDLDVPVVFMTGSPALETAIAAMEYGAYRYLMKPVEGKELVAVVERAAQVGRLAAVRRELGVQIDGKLLGDRASLESRFASAVEKMWTAMQPVLSWSSRTVFAYEALLRSDEPTLRNPLDFLDAAERLGRTAELGKIIRQKIAAQLPDAPPTSNVFVNLNPMDLVDDDLNAGKDALTPFASRIVLEVTERAALDRVEGLADGIGRLRALGYRLALDDLGAGYAGLSSFAQLEPEIVKVDMSLIRGIDGSGMKQKLFRSFTALCRDMKVEIIAEGVETPAERDCLTSLGGDLFQGYLFARPGKGFPAPIY
jgi:EAL domain-containing protein (putative c-di-GMP-specific phosphodiesterase class I)/CheY-like chemotaxis protein